MWEESIIMMSKAARFVFLSATIPNAREFAEWIATIHRCTAAQSPPACADEHCRSQTVGNRSTCSNFPAAALTLNSTLAVSLYMSLIHHYCPGRRIQHPNTPCDYAAGVFADRRATWCTRTTGRRPCSTTCSPRAGTACT